MIVPHMTVAIFTLLTAPRMPYVWHNQYLVAITVVASKSALPVVSAFYFT